MKKYILHICFLLASLPTWSQTIMIPPATPVGESCRILTDRSIYVAGEDIRFSLFYGHPDEPDGSDWSKVFYTELVSPSGDAFSRTKIKIDSTGPEGVLEIPIDLPSGTYFLKGYTKWMKNYGPGAYTYLSVDVVNPIIKTVLLPDTLSEYSLPLALEFEDSFIPGPVHSDMLPELGQRMLIQLGLTIEDLKSPFEACVTVVRQGSLGKQWKSSDGDDRTLLPDASHIPETRGISITGRVEESGTGVLVPFAMVYISLKGEENGFYCNYADSEGKFFFTLPESYMNQDLFIAAYHKEVGNLRIYIDQDFCLEPLRLPSYPFQILAEDEASIKAMVVNAQIRKQYEMSPSGQEFAGEHKENFFYGEPTSVIRFDDFIRLPTMEEYFTEVTPQISINRSNKHKSFSVSGTHPDLNHYDPLVLIDGVAIFDIESILAISPAYIDRIEIVEAPFIRGNLTFGGIIHLISRNGDMGYIDLPKSGLLVNYSMFDKGLPGNPVIQLENTRMPDVRNTLYWNPHIRIMPGIPEIIQFTTPDQTGTYQLVVRGFDSEGIYYENIFPFHVN